jgi:acetoin utilization protein AcuB
MQVKEIINNNYPQLSVDDTISRALHLIGEYRVQHLPVVVDGKLYGLVNEDELLDEADDRLPIKAVNTLPAEVSVKEDQFVLNILPIMAQHHLTVVPVIDKDKNYLGLVDESGIISWTSKFYNTNIPGAIIVLEMNPYQFSFSEISRLVETNNATIRQLNSQMNDANGMLLVVLKLNTNEVSDVVATFQRFEYDIKLYFGEEKYDNQIQENLGNLLNYLNM